MGIDPMHFLYYPGHVTLWCLQIVLVVYGSDAVPRKNMSELVWTSLLPQILGGPSQYMQQIRW